MTDEQIKYMTERFLTWKLPMLFAPDGGITFEHFRNVGTPYEARNEPTGTNLLHAGQAEAMIRHLVAGLPEAAPSSPGDGWVMVPKAIEDRERLLDEVFTVLEGFSCADLSSRAAYAKIVEIASLPAAPSPGGDQ